MVLRIMSPTAPCKGDSAIRFTTYPLMKWTSSCLEKKPVAINDYQYCSRLMRYSGEGIRIRTRRLARHRRHRRDGGHPDWSRPHVLFLRRADGPRASMTRRSIH